jgi:hypothetical protein
MADVFTIVIMSPILGCHDMNVSTPCVPPIGWRGQVGLDLGGNFLSLPAHLYPFFAAVPVRSNARITLVSSARVCDVKLTIGDDDGGEPGIIITLVQSVRGHTTPRAGIEP